MSHAAERLGAACSLSVCDVEPLAFLLRRLIAV